MIPHDQPNPFEILGLPIDATEEDVAERAWELETGADPDERLRYRWAREQIVTHPRTRREYEVFEVPGTAYQDPEWDEFARRHKRNPVDLRPLAATIAPPGLADIDLVELIGVLLDGLLDVPAPDVAAVLAETPVPIGLAPPPVEVRDVAFG